MEKFKVTCTEDNQIFVVTSAFSKLYKKFKELKTHKGRIINVTGSPGTGKSANIYHAMNLLDLSFYDVGIKLDSVKLSHYKVFEAFANALKRDFNVKTKEEGYNEISKFDVVVFADKLLDYGNFNRNRVELSEWLRHNRLKSIILYFIVIKELLLHTNELKKMNLVFHLTLTFMIHEKKYDILSDFKLLSRLFTGVLSSFFELVEIKYSELETIEIVKSHFKGIEDKQIKKFIRKYGCKPRYILGDIEEGMVNLKTTPPKIKP